MTYDARCWRVAGQQLDLLDNKPALILAHKKTGEVRMIHPAALREGVEALKIYDAGYLHGYGDGRAGRPPDPLVSDCSRNTLCDCEPEMVLGG